MPCFEAYGFESHGQTPRAIPLDNNSEQVMGCFIRSEGLILANGLAQHHTVGGAEGQQIPLNPRLLEHSEMGWTS
jgi:hypothetical protein